MGVSLILSFIPIPVAAVVSFMMFMCVLLAAYAMRRGLSEIDLTHNHMTYLIRTLWISGLVMILGLVASVIYMIGAIDNAPLDACLDNVSGVTPESSMDDMMAVFSPCMDEYMGANKGVLLISGVLAAVPILAYLIYRFVKGVKYAWHEQPVPTVKKWI